MSGKATRITKTKTGWRAALVRKGLPSRSAEFEFVDQAMRWAVIEDAAIAASTQRVGGKDVVVTVGETLRRFLVQQGIGPSGLSPVERYRVLLADDWMAEAAARPRLPEIIALAARLAGQGMDQVRVRCAMAALSAAYTLLGAWGGEAVGDPLREPAGDPPMVIRPEVGAIEAILEAAGQAYRPELVLMMRVQIEAGIGTAETADLTADSVGDGHMAVGTGAARRRVPVGVALEAELRELAEKAKGPLFGTTDKLYRGAFDKCVERAGVARPVEGVDALQLEGVARMLEAGVHLDDALARANAL